MKEKQSLENFTDEIRAEVNRCHLMVDDLTFSEKCEAMAGAIFNGLQGICYNVPSITSIEDCAKELNKVFKVVKDTKNLLLALRIHSGFLWLREQEIAAEKFTKKESITFFINGEQEIVTDIAKFKVVQQDRYTQHREDISRSIQLAKISKRFPEIINTDKNWTWLRRAITNDKLLDAIKEIQGEDVIPAK